MIYFKSQIINEFIISNILMLKRIIHKLISIILLRIIILKLLFIY